MLSPEEHRTGISVCLGCTAGHPGVSVPARAGNRSKGGPQAVGRPPGGRFCRRVLEAGPAENMLQQGAQRAQQ